MPSRIIKKVKKQKSQNGLTRKTHLQSFLFHLALKIICPRREREELALGLLLSLQEVPKVIKDAVEEKTGQHLRRKAG
ncbi:hypothetical protein NC652_026798 [Populus alba x Populus x berolinensis]|nr:hypothetical protein NC652_026777 [Populus alba x Populus x berolinensis]KAJ6900812.1 hypothetical protein NC652_026798 [Populus alba x Populus x berolinensis]